MQLFIWNVKQKVNGRCTSLIKQLDFFYCKCANIIPLSVYAVCYTLGRSEVVYWFSFDCNYGTTCGYELILSFNLMRSSWGPWIGEISWKAPWTMKLRTIWTFWEINSINYWSLSWREMLMDCYLVYWNNWSCFE